MRMAFGKKWLDPDQLVDIAVAMFDKAHDQYGLQTIVDGTPVNNGRDIHLMLKVAQKSKVQIIPSTGFYYCDDPFLIDKPIEYLEEVFLDECKNGISGTNILPGCIKCGIGPSGVTGSSELLLHLTGTLQKNSGLPMFAHTEAVLKNGTDMQNYLEKYGADLTKVVIGHTGDSNDIDYIEELLRRGSYIGMDRFGLCNNINSLNDRVDTIIRLADRGWLDRMLLSHDHSVYYDWGENYWPDFLKADNLNREYDFTYIHRRAIPLLLERGMTEKEINVMLVDNARDLFGK